MTQQNQARLDSFPCGPDYGVDWNFSGNSGWRMTDKEGIRWEDIGPMNEKGREVVIERFQLQDKADKLPLPVIAGLAPELLMQLSAGKVAIAA